MIVLWKILRIGCRAGYHQNFEAVRQALPSGEGKPIPCILQTVFLCSYKLQKGWAWRLKKSFPFFEETICRKAWEIRFRAQFGIVMHL